MVLLDTHALLFLLDARLGTLGAEAAQSISSAENVTVSAVSFYEIGQLARLRRVAFSRDDLRNLERQCLDAGVHILATSAKVHRKAASFDWVNRDPFDRIIITEAIETRAVLATRDRAISAYATNHPEQLRVIW